MTVLRTTAPGSEDLAPEPIDPGEQGLADALRRFDRAALLDQPLAFDVPDRLEAGADLVALFTALPEWSGPAPVAVGGQGFRAAGEHLRLQELLARRELSAFGPDDPARLPALAALVRSLTHQRRRSEVEPLAAPLVGRPARGEVVEILSLLGFVLAFLPRSRLHDDVLTSLDGLPQRLWVEQPFLMRSGSYTPERMLAWTDQHADEATPPGGLLWPVWHNLACLVAFQVGLRERALAHSSDELAACRWPLERVEAHSARATITFDESASCMQAIRENAAQTGYRPLSARAIGIEALLALRSNPRRAAELHLRAAGFEPDGPYRADRVSALILAGDLDQARAEMDQIGPRTRVWRLALTDPGDRRWEWHFEDVRRTLGRPHETAMVFGWLAGRVAADPGNSRRVRLRERARRLAAVCGYPDPLEDPLVDGPTAIPVGDYDLFEELGRGAMGVVHRAEHRRTGKEVAVKVLLGSRARDAHRAGFLAEMAVQATLAHPNIVEVVDAGEVDELAARVSPGLEAGSGWFAMERVRGGTLVSRCGLVDWTEALPMLLGILDALAHCHARGVIHCDLKPANVLLESGRPRVSDFGVARVASTGPVSGTPAYMAPEQFRGQVSPQTDLYALGVVAVELIQGVAPFLGSTRRLAQTHRVAPRPRLEGQFAVPGGFDAWVARAMAVDPADRFPSAAHAADGLLALGAAMDGSRRPPRRARAALSTLLAPDAILVEERPAPPVPAVLRPLPSGWASRAGGSGRLARAGLGSLHLRSPAIVGRVRERDTLWEALRRAGSGPVTAVIAGPAGLGGGVLVNWLCARVRELAVATTPATPAEVGDAGLQVLVVPDLGAVAEHLAGWRARSVPVLVLARAEVAGEADVVVQLTPLDDAQMGDLLTGLLDLSPDAVGELVVQAEGYPGAALHAIRDAHARGVFELGPMGLRNADRWQLASNAQLVEARTVPPERQVAAAVALLTAAPGSRHPGAVVAALAAMSVDSRREAFARAADALEGRAPVEWVLLLRACGPPDRAVFDAVLAYLGSVLSTTWHTSMRGFLRGSGPYGSPVVTPRDFGIGPEHPSSALIALHAAKAALWHSELDETLTLCDRAMRVEGPERPRLVGYASYLRATVMWRRGARTEALALLDGIVPDLASDERLVVLGRRLVWRLQLGFDARADLAYLEAHHDPALVASQRLLGLESAGRTQEGLDTWAGLPPAIRDAPVVRGRQGTLLVELGRHAEAEIVFRELIAQVPADTMRWLVFVENLAWVLAFLGRLDEAREELSRLRRRGSPTADALWLALRADDPDADLEGYHRRLLQPGADSLLHRPSLRWAYDTARARASEAGLTERATWLGAAIAELTARVQG